MPLSGPALSAIFGDSLCHIAFDFVLSLVEITSSKSIDDFPELLAFSIDHHHPRFAPLRS
jgi:hypothetical protein